MTPKKGKHPRRDPRQRVGLYLDRRIYAKLRKRLASEGRTSVTWWFEQRVAEYLG